MQSTDIFNLTWWIIVFNNPDLNIEENNQYNYYSCNCAVLLQIYVFNVIDYVDLSLQPENNHSYIIFISQ